MESITINGNPIALRAIVDFIKKWEMKVEIQGTIQGIDANKKLNKQEEFMQFMGAFNGVFTDENIKEAKTRKALK